MPRPAGHFYIEPRLPAWWNRVLIALTLAAIAILLVDLGLPPESATSRALGYADLILCLIFIADFAVRLRRAERRWDFVKRNWLDLVGSIPFVGPLRAARAVRLVRLLRFLRIAVLVRRILRRHDVEVPGSLRYIGLVATAIWLGAAAAFYAFEQDHNPNIRNPEDALWWSITTLSTVGYGDLYPMTLGGRAVALVTMVLGVGVLGTLAASLATAFIAARDRATKGLRVYSMKNHLLILGWNDVALEILHGFKADRRNADTDILIIAELESSPCPDSDVRFVRGSAAHRATLERASASQAAAAVVLAKDLRDPSCDFTSAVVVAVLRRLAPKARISAQLVSTDNREVLEGAGCDSVISHTLLASSLLVRSLQDLGAAELVHDLLSNAGGSQIYRLSIPARYIGTTYRDYASSLLEERVTLLALAREQSVQANPDPTLRLQAGDAAFIVAIRPPTEGR